MCLSSSNQWWLFSVNYHFGIEKEHNFLATKERIKQCNPHEPHPFVHKHNDKVIPTGHQHWSCFFSCEMRWPAKIIITSASPLEQDKFPRCIRIVLGDGKRLFLGVSLYLAIHGKQQEFLRNCFKKCVRVAAVRPVSTFWLASGFYKSMPASRALHHD